MVRSPQGYVKDMVLVQDVWDISGHNSHTRAGNTPDSRAAGPRLDGDLQAVKAQHIQDIILASQPAVVLLVNKIVTSCNNFVALGQSVINYGIMDLILRVRAPTLSHYVSTLISASN